MELENNLTRTQDWIKSADQKISIWIAFEGVLTTLISPYLFTRIFLCS